MAPRGRTVAMAFLALGIALVLWRAFGTGTGGTRGGGAVQPAPAVADASDDARAAPALVGRELPVEAEPAPAAPRVETPADTPARSPGPERTVVGGRAKPRAVVRGRVVHERSGQGLPGLEILISPRKSKTYETVVSDEDGRFESATRFGREWLALSAADPFALGERLRPLRHHHRPADGSSPPCEVLWEIDGGLIVRLAITREFAADGWRARVVETMVSGAEEEWSWIELVPHEREEGFWLRYPKPRRSARVRPPGDRVRVDVTDERRSWWGSAPLETAVGIHPGIVVVDVALRAAAVEGRVTDEAGVPVEARVIAIRRGPARPGEPTTREAGTDGEGRYALDGLAPSPHRFLVASDHQPVTRFDLDLVAGTVVTRDVVVATKWIAGDIEGALVGPPGGGSPFALVRLEALDGPTDLVELVGLDFDLFGKKRATSARSAFAFRDLPEGSYRISLTPLDDRRYEPESLEVSPPHAGAVFTTTDAEGEGEQEVVLVVRDARTGERLAGYTLLARIDRYWATDVMDVGPGLLDDGDRYPRVPMVLVVSAPGYRPATVDLVAARTDEDRVTLTVDLEPGWGLALVIADAEHLLGGSQATFEEEVLPARGLAGIEVLVDGRPAGRSGADGLALLALDGPIEAERLGLRGATILLVRPFRSHAATPAAVGFVFASRD